MRRLMVACLALVCTTVSAQQSLDANVQQLGPKAFRIRVTFPFAVMPNQAQAMLADVGTQLCGGQAATWGHYSFETVDPVGPAKGGQPSTRFEQDLTCGGEPIAKSGTPAPKTPATDADRRDIEARTLDYLSKKDHGDFAAADAMFDAQVLAQISRPEWRDDRRAFNAAAGLPESRKILAVTFYDDPADAPSLGRYAAADYRAAFADRAFYCGYVMWLRQADGSWRLLREEESIIDGAQARKLADAELAKVKVQPGCREP